MKKKAAAKPAEGGNWGDLGPRAASATGMIAVGGAALWAGGVWFAALGVAIIGLMVWELVRMIRPRDATGAWQEALVAAVAAALALWFPAATILILGALLVVLVGRTGRHPLLVAGFGAGIFLAGTGLVDLRLDMGLTVTLWLIGVVVATDIAGYFAGRMIGGPKFWPAVSPKKTWSGTIAGWAGAMAVTWAFLPGAGWFDVLVSAPLLSLASQMGDIAESALKRKLKIKDSSNLIPGHGGVLDRFDGMMGAALATTLVLAVASMLS